MSEMHVLICDIDRGISEFLQDVPSGSFSAGPTDTERDVLVADLQKLNLCLLEADGGKKVDGGHPMFCLVLHMINCVISITERMLPHSVASDH